MSASRPLRAGIIGAGRIAWSYDGGRWDGMRSVSHAACFDRHPQTTLVALYDPIDEARAAFVAGYAGVEDVFVTNDLNRFLKRDLDVVAIASPTEFHKDHLSTCLAAGIPFIWVEKPVTLTLTDHDRLLMQVGAQRNPPRICVNYFRRALPQVAEIKQKMADGFTVTACEVTYSRKLSVNGVHLMDLLEYLFGETPKALDYWRVGAKGNPSYGMTLGDVPVTVIGLDLPYHAIELRLTGPTGRLSLIEGGAKLMWEAVEANPDYPGFFRLASPTLVYDRAKAIKAMQDGTYLMLCNLLDCETASLSTLASSRFAQVVLELSAQQSEDYEE